ncbi:unnamed protein product [Dibothriocephalus latus]|uniref:Uncharacterized protein n=1 Tax=Dibothriocephalus latus TaxID=60516 RepID=A0A3P7MGE2_DIBLA|nr:unnamed protein product [Dibothriocephalus latus]
MLRESTVEEPIQATSSGGISRSREVALHDNIQARDTWCPFCSQWVDTPLQMTPYFSEPVCNECKRSAERGVHSNSQRSRNVGDQEERSACNIAAEKESGVRVNHIEGRAVENPPAASAPNLPSSTLQHDSKDANGSIEQGVGRSAEETRPAPSAAIQRESSAGIRSRGEVAWQDNHEDRGGERCSFCSQWTAEASLKMSQYFSEPVCNECRSDWQQRTLQQPITCPGMHIAMPPRMRADQLASEEGKRSYLPRMDG